MARFRRSPLYMIVRMFVTFALVPVPAILAGEVIAYAGLYFGPDQKASICKITRVIDGDTVAMRCSTPGSDRGRIRGIDTPELFSPQCASEAAAAYKAKWALQVLLWSAGEIKVIISGTDRYDRRLVTIFADGRDVAQSLVAGGHGRRYDGGQRRDWCT